MREKTDHFGEADHPGETHRFGGVNHVVQLRDAPWPATKDELIEFAARTGAALQLLEELYALPDGDTRYVAHESLLAPLPHHRGVA